METQIIFCRKFLHSCMFPRLITPCGNRESYCHRFSWGFLNFLSVYQPYPPPPPAQLTVGACGDDYSLSEQLRVSLLPFDAAQYFGQLR